jgi:signal transduction histidine kinase
VINNSFNHTKEGDKVSVVIDILSDKVKIQITDTGEGIRREDLDRIWERYYRTLDLKDKKSSGTGLGLAIVKSILAAHKSKFGVFSEEDKGTTFWFDIEKSN